LEEGEKEWVKKFGDVWIVATSIQLFIMKSLTKVMNVRIVKKLLSMS